MEDFKDWHTLQVELDASRVDQAAIKKLALTVGEFHKATYGEGRVAELEKDFG